MNKVVTALAKYPLMQQVLELVRTDSREQAEFAKEVKQSDWANELDAIPSDLAALDEIVAQHMSAKREEKADVWAWLERLVFCGGFGDPIQAIACKLTDRLITCIEPERKQQLLSFLNNRQASYFFIGGRWLTSDLMAQNFSVRFVADWFVGRFVAYGDDGAVGDLWRLLHRLAEESPAFAFELAQTPEFSTAIDGRKFQVELLGGLRFRATLPAAVEAALPTVLEPMRTHASPTERANYWRTMKRPLGLARLPDDQLEAALVATSNSDEEHGIGYELAKAGSQEPTPKPQTICLLKWLHSQFDRPLTPGQQYDMASVVWLTVERVTPDELGFDVGDFLLKIQPVDQAHRGIWRQIEFALYPLSRISRPRFHRVLQLIARQHWGMLAKMLEPNAPLYGAATRLAETPEQTAEFATQLCASRFPGERRLGFYLIETLQLPAPQQAGGVFSREEFIMWLSEFRVNIVYRTVAQQLARAAARIDLNDAAMVHTFQEEVLYQCKNLPGLCLSQIKKLPSSPLFSQAIKEADEYFTALEKLNQSPIKAQQIPGLSRAIRRKRVRDQVKMDEAVAAHSIFEQFVKKSYLLYGTRWATFNGGVLGKESELTTHSVSAEYPRKAVIDPEGALRQKLSARAELKRFKPSEGEDEDA